MNKSKEILIEGYTESEILELSQSQELQDLVFSNEPLIFKIGSSEILAQFGKSAAMLDITLSHIIGGGGGGLLKLLNLVQHFAKKNEFTQIRWTVYAVNCAKPNPKLPRMLELKKFEIVEDPIDGSVYRKIENVSL